MINENIRKARKARGMSQEELAVQLNVVRQTVSKWENGLSVPDADVLVRMAGLLDVPAEQLLGLGAQDGERQELAERLAQLNEQLARKNQREKLIERANRKRGMILFLAFATMMIALAVKNEIASILLCGGCILAAVVILYRNLALLTSITTNDMKLRTLRAVTIFDAGVFLVVIAFAVLGKSGWIPVTEDGGKAFAMGLTILLMLFIGFVAPRLPFTRHTGLRLPWTVADEDTWNVAHRVLGIITLPVVLLYLAAARTVSDFKTVSITVLLLWIGIPGGVSLLFFWRKMRGKI